MRCPAAPHALVLVPPAGPSRRATPSLACGSTRVEEKDAMDYGVQTLTPEAVQCRQEDAVTPHLEISIHAHWRLYYK